MESIGNVLKVLHIGMHFCIRGNGVQMKKGEQVLISLITDHIRQLVVVQSACTSTHITITPTK